MDRNVRREDEAVPAVIAEGDGPSGGDGALVGQSGVDLEIIIGPHQGDGSIPVTYTFASVADTEEYRRLLRERDAVLTDGGAAILPERSGDREEPSGLTLLSMIASVEQAARRLDPDVVAAGIARILAPQLRQLVRPTVVPPDDAFVDQDSGLYDREVYLRLARNGAFAAKVVGKKRVARWAEVKVGFAGAGKPITVVEPTEDPEVDLLNEIRQRAGLAIKGGR